MKRERKPKPDFHGWGRQDIPGLSLHVGMLPGRKRPQLYVFEGAQVMGLASFRDVAAAQEAVRVLDIMAWGTDAKSNKA